MSLIETALLLCLIGVVLAAFVPSFMRRVRTNKVSEAAALLEEMSARTSAYYTSTQPDGQRHCLPPGAGPTPEVPTEDLAEVDFASVDVEGHTTWEALGFQPDRPIRYSYSYLPTRHGCELVAGAAPVTVMFRAEGDLDGDGVRSRFERTLSLSPDGSAESESLHVEQRVE